MILILGRKCFFEIFFILRDAALLVSKVLQNLNVCTYARVCQEVDKPYSTFHSASATEVIGVVLLFHDF